MAVASQNDGNFMANTWEWINEVNRGGLFPLNDASFNLFISIEKEVKVLFPTYMAKLQDSKEDKLSIMMILYGTGPI